jgi:hypothetical protein
VTLRVHPWAAKLPEISRRVIRSANSPTSSDEEPYLVIIRYILRLSRLLNRRRRNQDYTLAYERYLVNFLVLMRD